MFYLKSLRGPVGENHRSVTIIPIKDGTRIDVTHDAVLVEGKTKLYRHNSDVLLMHAGIAAPLELWGRVVTDGAEDGADADAVEREVSDSMAGALRWLADIFEGHE